MLLSSISIYWSWKGPPVKESCLRSEVRWGNEKPDWDPGRAGEVKLGAIFCLAAGTQLISRGT